MYKLKIRSDQRNGNPTFGVAKNDAELLAILKVAFTTGEACPDTLYISEFEEGKENDAKTHLVTPWLLKQIPDIANFIGLIVQDIQSLDVRIKALDAQLNPKPVEGTVEPKA